MIGVQIFKYQAAKRRRAILAKVVAGEHFADEDVEKSKSSSFHKEQAPSDKW